MFVAVGIPWLLWLVAIGMVGLVAGRRGQGRLLWLLIAVYATPFLAAFLLLTLTRPPEPRAPA